METVSQAPNPAAKTTKKTGLKKSFWRKLGLLLWKNLLLRRRHWILTALEVLLPTLLFTLLLTIRILPNSVFLPKYVNETSRFSVSSEENLRRILCYKYGVWLSLLTYCYVDTINLPGQRKLFYGPPGNFTQGVARHIAEELGMPDEVLEVVSSNEDIDVLVDKSYFETNDSFASFFMGLYFHDLDDPGPVAPQHLKYDLRLTKYWFTSQLYPFLQVPGPRNYSLNMDNLLGSYNMDGFTLIQSLVDRYYIAQLTQNNSYVSLRYQLETQMYPYPPYVQDRAMSQFYGSALPTFVVLSLVLLSPSLIKSIVYEKETGVRELVRLMGLDGWLVWLGWFLHSFIIIIVVASIITLVLKLKLMPLQDGSGFLPPILAYSDPIFIWVLLLLYGISSIAFCFVIATFFSKPTLATTVGVLLWLTSYFIPRTVLDYDYNSIGLTPKIFSCLLPNLAITWAFRVISMFEGRVVGVQWNNVWETGNPRDQLAPAMILLMLVIDTCLFLFITWYVDQVSPGLYGVPRPWYFPFQKTYWHAGTPRLQHHLQHQDVTTRQNEEYFEMEPVGLRPGIIIKNLRKEFKTLGGKVKVAVEDVSMTCYEGQCTVLLGHNGAGKTTTMSILTGVFAPSGGYAEVGGWNIATNLAEAREEVGLCPQHNMLFVDLTVLQHLLFFGRLKGMTTAASREEGMGILRQLDLHDKQDFFGNQLSGGMKRKLCLAISLIGGSKVVILDEPSSGLDPESRRWVWDVVQGERGRRTVLVTTHHMEEADVLGDRVAIMASGRVVCAGSSLFLKNKFGDGYTLEMMVTESCNVESVKAEVKTLMPSASLHKNQGMEITFKLPPTTSKFAPLLESLTSRKEQLGLRHIGLSLTTMERVFLGVSELMEKNEEIPKASELGIENCEDDMNGSLGASIEKGLASSSQQHLYNDHTNSPDRLSGHRLLLQRIKGFFIKRIIYSKRKWPLIITQGLIPVVVTISCLLVDQTFDMLTSQEPPLDLNLSIFSHSYSFFSNDPDLYNLADQYESLFWDSHEVSHVDNMTQSLLQEADKNLLQYRENHICSAEFLDNGKEATIRILAQTIPYHTLGIGASLASNALLKLATNSSSQSITTTNWPLPPDTTWKFTSEFTMGSIVYSNMMPLALAFLSASFLVFPLQERESSTKQVQVMTGAPIWALWTTTFLWDFATYLASMLLIFICFMALDFHGYFTSDIAPGALFVLLLLYGWGSIPMAYVFSFPFQTAASGFAVLALVNIIAGELMTVVVFGLRAANQKTLTIVSDVLYWITSTIPAFPVANAFAHLVDVSVHNKKCDQFNESVTERLCSVLALVSPNNSYMECCNFNDPPMCSHEGNQVCFETWSYFRFIAPGLAPDLLTLFANGLIFIAIIIILESGGGVMFQRVWRSVTFQSRLQLVTTGVSQVVDEDVTAEADLVASLMTPAGATAHTMTEISQDTTLIACNLSKQYSGCLTRAVDNISFRVGRGECLGLLGVNGAGKTTTFKMLTGDEIPTEGDAVIDGLSLRHERNKFVQNIGYCPQFDAFLGDLTGVEMLQLMGRLRGINETYLKEVIATLVPLVDLTECAERPSSTYSGGNRRKLSTAMALVGSPPLVFLDEPTSGVDPVSRRRVWGAVSQATRNGQSVVLTSHSMEECEALCSRIIIMAKGTLRCVGSTGHLKAKFGQGYSLQVKLRTHGFTQGDKAEDEHAYNINVSMLKNVISHHLPGSTLIDQHKGMLAYRIPSNVPWGQLFSVMEALKAGRDPYPAIPGSQSSSITSSCPSIVEVYAASDTTLEQVFLSFAREEALEQTFSVSDAINGGSEGHRTSYTASGIKMSAPLPQTHDHNKTDLQEVTAL